MTCLAMLHNEECDCKQVVSRKPAKYQSPETILRKELQNRLVDVTVNNYAALARNLLKASKNNHFNASNEIKHISLIAQQAHVTGDKALATWIKHDFDIVNAIMELTM